MDPVKRASSLPAPRRTSRPPGGLKVMIIDDSELTLDSAKSYLGKRGYTVRTAAGLAEFEGQLTAWTPDVILADVTMPEMSGAELCKHLKMSCDTSHVFVLLFSNLPEADLEHLAIRCGADGFFSKRNGLSRLADQLDQLCQEVIW